jgi:ABC-2 type transport system ATP-binding protein
LLSEVEQIASHIGIIHEGHLLFQGTLAELQAKQQSELTVGVKQLDQAIACLKRAGWVVQKRAEEMLTVSAHSSEDAVRINSLLVDHRLDVFHLALAQVSLEDIFLTLTRERTA